jgi:hypothetical protein
MIAKTVWQARRMRIDAACIGTGSDVRVHSTRCVWGADMVSCRMPSPKRRLTAGAIEEGKSQNLAAITLTRVVEMPWNAPFHIRPGCAMLDRQMLAFRLTDVPRQKVERDFARETRCAVRLPLLLDNAV